MFSFIKKESFAILSTCSAISEMFVTRLQQFQHDFLEGQSG